MRMITVLSGLVLAWVASPAFAQGLPSCQYNPNGLGLAPGQVGPLQCNADGTLKTALGSAVTTGATPASSQVTCATTAVQALAADTTKAVRTLSNQSGATVYLGPSGVTSSTGFPVPSGAGYDASSLTGALYCATASGTAVVGVLQY